jgi:hypothetical protein
LAGYIDAHGFPVVLFVVTRVAIFAFSSLSLRLTPTLFSTQFSISKPVLERWPALDGMCRWDCAIYGQMARDGYQTATDTNMWPLYPWLSRGLAAITGIHLHYALMIVPQVACLASYLVLYRLFVSLEGRGPARWSLVAFAFFPFAFFQSAGYPESLMILATASSVALALRGRHIWAGVALAAAVMSRHLGLLAGASVLVIHVLERGWHPKALLWTPRILGPFIPLAVLGAWSLYLHYKFGDALAYVHARNQWGSSAWWSVVDLYRNSDITRLSWFVISLVPGLGSFWLLSQRRWWALAPFGMCLMVLMWTIGGAGLGRYAASCWPGFLPVGKLLYERSSMQGIFIGVLALAQGLWLYLFVHQWWVV